MLLGPKGVGKSTLAQTLLGNFSRSIGSRSKIKTFKDHFLGIGQCVTIIDTSGPPRNYFNKRNLTLNEGKSSCFVGMQ